MTLSLDMESSSKAAIVQSASGPLRTKQFPARSLMGLDWLFYNLVFAIAYPAFCLAEWLNRQNAPQELRPRTALFAEARKNEHIALSYAFGVRKMLHQCGPGDRVKRPS